MHVLRTNLSSIFLPALWPALWPTLWPTLLPTLVLVLISSEASLSLRLSTYLCCKVQVIVDLIHLCKGLRELIIGELDGSGALTGGKYCSNQNSVKVKPHLYFYSSFL